MLKNAYLVAKIGVDTAENDVEPPIKSDVSWLIGKDFGDRQQQLSEALAEQASAASEDARAPSQQAAEPAAQAYAAEDQPRHSTLSEARSRLYQHRF